VVTAGADVRSQAKPFSEATALEPLGDGRYKAELGRDWSFGPKAHGGFLLALLAKAGLARLEAETPGSALDPLSVSADFLRAPDLNPVELSTEVLKMGRTASVVAVRMTQDGRTMLAATLTAGRLPGDEPRWADLPDLPAEPPADATDPSAGRASSSLHHACDLRLDTPTLAYLRGQRGRPLLRGWARPHGEPTDVLFALLAGDVLPPSVFNLGESGWAPTVQLTALLRARPAPGWLRMEGRSSALLGPWFDEDVTVIDSAGRLVCQARQLALAPLAR
jgi:hypothetical protein